MNNQKILGSRGFAVRKDGIQIDPVQAENQRIQEIDALASLYDRDTIHAAKYGDTACTAQEMAYRYALNLVKQDDLSPQHLMAQGRADAKALKSDKEDK